MAVNNSQESPAPDPRPLTPCEAFQISNGDVVSLVGGGGKTALMFCLAQELVQRGRVVTTTTTKIFPPARESSAVLVEPDEAQLWRQTTAALEKYRHITLAAKPLPAEGKLQGVRPEFVDGLKKSGVSDFILVEADGARGRSLKAPREGEPVVPDSTSVLIPVLGLDVLGRTVSGETVFRPEVAQRLVACQLGDPITIEFMVKLVTHPQGICKGTPKHAKIIPFINKVESRQAIESARRLALGLRQAEHFSIDSVVIGSVRNRYFERY